MTPTKNDDTTSRRVIRGGCWFNTVPARVRASNRGTDAPAVRDYYLGFRCSLPGRVKR